MATSTAYHEGQRLSYDGHLCTVRYIGKVRGTKGEWLGVEWDDAKRGKHAGVHGGENYFDCKNTIVAMDPRLDLTGQALVRHRRRRPLFDHQDHMINGGRLSKH